MRPQRQHHAKPVMTVAQATLQLRLLLTGCSDTALAAFTPDYLAATHKVKLADAARMLDDQRAYRGRLV